MRKYYARMGTFKQAYFCCAPYNEISLGRYLFERFIARNECVRTRSQLVKELELLKNKSRSKREDIDMLNISLLLQDDPEAWKKTQIANGYTLY